ncbi:MAG: GGDEF domain-containing protein [Firmicutes bacterium]|nr:GGDEF domain-containing protein [Bacillota bacterium]
MNDPILLPSVCDRPQRIWRDSDQAEIAQINWKRLASHISDAIAQQIKEEPHWRPLLALYAPFDHFSLYIQHYISQFAADPRRPGYCEYLLNVGNFPLTWGLDTEWFLWGYSLIMRHVVTYALTQYPTHAPKLFAMLNKRLELDCLVFASQQTSFFTFHDSLTHLDNRAKLDRCLSARIHRQEPFAVILADLDNFKAINDKWGHLSGDAVLQTVAQRWQQSPLPYLAAGRWGGDEFLFLIKNAAGGDDVGKTAVQLLSQALNKPVQIRQHLLTVSASFGLARYPQDGQTTDALLYQADCHLYEEKHRKHQLS